jgi:predicted ABC-type transport system involved in lysophospholipase L1 biosynthesis ATPase subunit
MNAATVTKAAMEVKALSVTIRTPTGRVPVVREAGFTVRSGQTLALLGESGCGKSMTAQAIAGLLDPVAEVTGGEVLLEGKDLLRLDRRERRKLAGPGLAMVFQDALTALNPVYTVGTQLAEPFRIHEGLSRRAAREKAVELMERVGIPEPRTRAGAYPHQFSGGISARPRAESACLSRRGRSTPPALASRRTRQRWQTCSSVGSCSCCPGSGAGGPCDGITGKHRARHASPPARRACFPRRGPVCPHGLQLFRQVS